MIELQPFLLGHIPVGTTAWTVPWALYLSAEHRWYVNPDVTHQPQLGLVSTLQVTRTETGWLVDVSQCEFDWKSTALPDYAHLSQDWQPATVQGSPRIAPYLDP